MKCECSMAAPPSAQEARQSLNASAAAIGAGIYAKYGPRIGWTQLLQILEDRTCVRYPCQIVFDAAPLQEGEFAHPVGRGIARRMGSPCMCIRSS